MPERIVQIGGATHRFPADATDAEISAALEAAQSSTPAPKSGRTWTDAAVDALPMAGGLVGGIAGGIGGTVLGMGVGGAPGAIGGAALGGAAGEGFKEVANYLRGKPSPTTATEAATNMGKEAAIQGVMEAGGQAIPKVLTKGAQAVYRGYLKPSLRAGAVGRADQIVKTALDEALPISKAGEGQANRVIGELRKDVEAELARTSGSVDLRMIADKMRRFARAKYFRAGTDQADYQVALRAADTVDQHASRGAISASAPPQRYLASLPEANRTKQALGKGVPASQWGQAGSAAEAATRKEGYRAAREAIEAQTGGAAGDVAKKNARETKLIDAAKAITAAVGREANQHQVYGMKSLIAGGAAGLDYGRNRDPWSAFTTGVATRIGLHPAVASRAAIVASRLGKLIPGSAPAAVARAAIAAVSEAQEEP